MTEAIDALDVAQYVANHTRFAEDEDYLQQVLDVVEPYIDEKMQHGVSPDDVRLAVLVGYVDSYGEAAEDGSPRSRKQNGLVLYGSRPQNRYLLKNSDLFDEFDVEEMDALANRARDAVKAAFPARDEPHISRFPNDYPYIVEVEE